MLEDVARIVDIPQVEGRSGRLLRLDHDLAVHMVSIVVI